MLKVEHSSDYLKDEGRDSQAVELLKKKQQSKRPLQPKSRLRRQYNPDDINIAKLFLAIREHKTGNPQLDKINEIKVLLIQIQNINDIDFNDNGNTPLHVAVSKGHQDIVKLLLNVPDIDPKIKNNQGDTPLDIAVRSGNQIIIGELQKYSELGSSNQQVSSVEQQPRSDDTLKGLQTREPISIFQEIKDQSEKQNLEGLLNKLRSSYSDDLKIGVALKTGDCFFDSVAQGLNELKDKGMVENSERFNVKSLRKDCVNDANKYRDKIIKDAEDYFVPQKNVAFPHLENIKDEKVNDVPDVQETFDKYLDSIKKTAEEGDYPIWGRPEIEGQMISSKYDIVFYFYSTNEENGQKITVTKITPRSDDPEVFIEGENLDRLHIDSNEKVVRIVNYKKHFVPLLSRLEKDIEKAIEVSREEVYGMENKKSSPLIDDISNLDLEENNDPNISEQVERSSSTSDTDDNINTKYKYNDHMILKVWDNFVSKKGLEFYVGKNHGDSGERYESSLFHGDDKMSLAITAGLLINSGREIYRNSDGYSVSMCQAVDYTNNAKVTGENSISSSVRDALNQINLWNQQHENEITKHKVLFPYHDGPNHWVLGVITLKYEQGILKDSKKDSKLEIYNPMGTGFVHENVKSELEEVLNDRNGHIELRVADESKKQQNDVTSCGAITAENGKDIIEGKSERLRETYKSGAYELRKRHVEEVNNARFTEIQHNNVVYRTGKAEILDNIDDIANNFHSFLNSLSDEDYNKFKDILEKLKEYNSTDSSNSSRQSVSRIFNEYKDKLKEFGVLDHFFTDGQQGLTWKDNACDNLEYLVKEKNLFDLSNRRLRPSNSGNSQTIDSPRHQQMNSNSPDTSNHDTPKEELKIPTKEKPKKKSQDSEQQSPGLSANIVKRVDNDPNQAGSSHQSSSDDNRIQDESWTSNQEHAAGELKRSLHGNDYQLKLLMLFASKGKNSKVAFRLATEIAEAEKFDDLVFRYTDSQDNIKYRFLQAKHKQFLGEENKIKVSDLKSDSDNNDFSLQKYFVSYLRDIEKKEFLDGVPEDFIICTNTDFDFEPSTTKNEQKETKDSKKTWKAYFSKKTDDDTVLNLGGKRYQFNKDPSIRTKIISELKPIFQKSLEKNKLSNDNVKKIDGFLDKLVFAVEQPSGASLEQKIKDTIGNEFNLINEIIYNDFFKFMHDWMKHRKKDPKEKGGGRAHFLTDKDIEQFLSEASKKIASLGLISSTLLCKREIEKFGLEFKDNIEAVKEIREFLSKQGSKERILIVCSKSGLLSKIKVFQMLASHDANRSIFSDLKSLSLLVDSSVDPVSAFNSKERNYLIIENLSTPDKDAKDLLSNFYQIVIKELNKKFILIIQPEQKDNIQKLFEDENYVKIIEDDDNKLKDLTSKSQEKILETEITLFGKPKQLNSLTTGPIKDDLYSAIDGDALTTLINSDSNVIGSKHKYDFDTYIDIPRTLTYQTKIDKKCLEENKNDLFAISGIEKSDFSQLVPEKEKRREFVDKDSNEKGPIRFIRLDNHRDIKKDFDELCRDYKERTIHLLENKDSVLEWKQSHGSLFNLRRFILETGSQPKKIKDLTNLAIIAGEAGMGKSTILTTYSMSKDFLWPIRINLKDYQTDINNANFDDLSGIVEFLSNIIDPASSKTSLIKNLLQYCLTQQGQITLLLDGYDEIKDRSQEKVVQLLRTLRTTQGKVLITTRSHVRSELEDALGIFAYSLDAFDKKQQKEFLKNFWIKTLNVKEPTQEKKN